jgi:hypothetical protein
VQHLGTIDRSRSYVQVRSAAGTRYLKVRGDTEGRAWALWQLTPAERRLKRKQFTYQAHLRSTANGAMVKSPPRVVLVRPRAAAPAPPAWTPDRR